MSVDTLETNKLSDDLRDVLLLEFFADEFGEVDLEAAGAEHADSVALISALCAAADDATPEIKKKLSDAIVAYLAEQRD